ECGKEVLARIWQKYTLQIREVAPDNPIPN
ncbi:MAG: hypothetical protein ACI8T1_005040, partial [Verrucomicrobiales bacterium]